MLKNWVSTCCHSDAQRAAIRAIAQIVRIAQIVQIAFHLPQQHNWDELSVEPAQPNAIGDPHKCIKTSALQSCALRLANRLDTLQNLGMGCPELSFHLRRFGSRFRYFPSWHQHPHQAQIFHGNYIRDRLFHTAL